MAAPALRPCEPATNIIDCQDVDAVRVDEYLMVATTILWKLSGRQYGICAVVDARPCSQDCVERWDPGWFEQTGGWDRALLLRCGRCRRKRRTCGCDHVDSFELGRRVVEVTEVKVDGVTLDASAYRVDNFRDLVRLDGESWPTCQNIALPSTEPDTWSVSWRFGRPWGPDGQAAVSKFACELLRADSGEDCQLPDRITSISRAGSTITLLDPMDFLDKGRTGIYLVDQFLGASNPRRSMRPARVFRADAHGGVRRVDT